MKESPEANEVIISYKENQYPVAIDYITRSGIINEVLAKAMYTMEEAHKKHLKTSARDRVEHEMWTREREERKRNFKIKMLELKTNIRQQKKPNQEMKGLNKDKNNLFWNCWRKITYVWNSGINALRWLINAIYRIIKE